MKYIIISCHKPKYLGENQQFFDRKEYAKTFDSWETGKHISKNGSTIMNKCR